MKFPRLLEIARAGCPSSRQLLPVFRPVFVPCFVLLLLLACSKPPAISEREAATRILAEYLSAEVHPKAVLVISNPYSQTSGRPAEVYQFERAGIAGITGVFGKDIPVKVAFPALSKQAVEDPASISIDPKTTTPLSFLVAENAFQALVTQHPDHDLVISLIGLPLNLQAFPAWTKPGPPYFGLLMPDWRIIGDREAILAAFQSGKLKAAVVRMEGASFGLVTATNIARLFETKPGLFKP